MHFRSHLVSMLFAYLAIACLIVTYRIVTKVVTWPHAISAYWLWLSVTEEYLATVIRLADKASCRSWRAFIFLRIIARHHATFLSHMLGTHLLLVFLLT